MDQAKDSKELKALEILRKSLSRKRKNVFNPKTFEQENNSFYDSAKKAKRKENLFVPEDHSVEYRIINFITVFSTIATFLKCKDCGGEVKFQTSGTHGLGFQIVILCDTCEDRVIPSCSHVGEAYEINRRFIFVMRLLGFGLAGAQKFCGLMDMPKFFYQSTYDTVVRNIYAAVIIGQHTIFRKAVADEMNIVSTNSGCAKSTELTVTCDGVWKKRLCTSLFGISSVIGYYTGKVLDISVESLFCKMCEAWRGKTHTAEYAHWFEEHESVCSVNSSELFEKMEVDCIVNMFKRSEGMYGVKYVNYIGEGDSKIYDGILDASPYEGITVTRNECVDDLQKRMGRSLRKWAKKNKGGNKLTGKMIDVLTAYYGIAIRSNPNAVKDMQKAIWASFHHYNSTDADPHHEDCPPGDRSWCSWQRASANGELVSYKHEYTALPVEVSEAIKPIYRELSNETLLERYKGGYTGCINKKYNQPIWEISSTISPQETMVVHIAAIVNACMFNEGYASLLLILHAMGVSCGRNSHAYVSDVDENRLNATDCAPFSTHNARLSRRPQQIDSFETSTSTEGMLYGTSINDSIYL